MVKPVHNQPPSNDPESSTQLRYSLAYPMIGSTDTIVRHVSGEVRIVTYEPSDEKSLRVREAMIQKGLVLGSRVTSPDRQTDSFRVPKSARPIAYDSRVQAAGAFSYNDEQLFFDLGSLLGNLYTAIDDTTVAIGDIGRAITYVEFTEPNQRQLYFVPGFEKITESLSPQFSPLDYYAERLGSAFEGRFQESQNYFNMGFADAISHSLEGEP